MTTQSVTAAELRRMLCERRAFAPGSPDHEYRTRAARKLVWIMRGVPVARWPS